MNVTMKKISVLLFVLLIHLQIIAQDHPILVDAKWVKDHLSDANLVILHTSFLRLDYAKEHIEGARFLWPGWLAPDSPDGSFNAPSADAATEILQKLGINSNSHVVIC